MDNEKRANDYQVGGDHYRGTPMQHWDLAAENQLGYFEGQVTKYLTRWRKKNGVEDLDKAMHYLQKLIESIREGFIRLPGYRFAKQLGTFGMQQQLTEDEYRIFRIMLCYTTIEELRVAMEGIKKLKEQAQ